MTRVLLVYHDPTVADTEGDMLRAAGYEVDRCAGPIGGGACPVLQGLPCWQVDQADVLVYDTWDPMHGGRPLIDELREFHPDKPLVLTTPVRFEAGERVGRAPVVAAETRSALIPAIEQAVARRPAAHPPHREEVAAHYHGPRW